MEHLKSVAAVKEVIQSESLTFLYIGQENCSVCHGLKPQISKIMSAYPEVRLVELDALEVPDVAEAFQVLTVPVLLLFVEGKEYLRKARIVNTMNFKQDVHKIITGYQQMRIVNEEEKTAD